MVFDIEQRLAQIEVHSTAEQIVKLEKIVEEHLKWNRKINLSAYLDEQAVIDYQIIDSLTLLQSGLNQTSELLDVGTGPGFPGLPLAVMCPTLETVLCDSNAKKLAFATQLVGQLKLKNVRIVAARVEELRDRRYSQMTARAFSKLGDIMGLTSQLLDPSGVLFAMKSQKVEVEIQDAQRQFPNASIEIQPLRHVVPEVRVIAKVMGYSQ